jgi:hypothetical protein
MVHHRILLSVQLVFRGIHRPHLTASATTTPSQPTDPPFLSILSAYLSELSPRLSRHAPLLYAYGINSNESIEMLLSWSNESFQTFFKFDMEPVKRLMIVDGVECPLGSGYLERMGHFDVVLLEHQFTERRAQLAKARAEARKAVHGKPVMKTEDL